MRLNELYMAVQGEGTWLGTPALFIRLHGCPVHCAWCDTAFTWDGTEKGEELAISEIGHRAFKLAPWCHHFVVTGGEPLVHSHLPELVEQLDSGPTDARVVEIETAGIAPPPPMKETLGCHVHWNVSPKLPSAHAKILPDHAILKRWKELDGKSTSVAFKFVVGTDEDLAQARALVATCEIPSNLVYLMPEGFTREAHARNLAWLLEEVVRQRLAGVRVTPRMQVAAYDKKRGV